MSKRKATKHYANTCSVCGETFYSAQKAQFCNDKSTCRVKFHQQKKLATKIAATFTQSMEAYAMYQAIVNAKPETKSFLDAFLFKHGVVASEDMLTIMFNILDVK